MSLKKGGGPKTIAIALTVVGQGFTDKFGVVYHNHKSSEVRAKLDAGATMGAMIPFIVSSWDSDFAITEEGVDEFEDEYPGIISALMEGFWKARRKEMEGN